MRSLTNETVISPGKQSSVSLRELWLYRELFYFFAWRDIKVRYKQSVLGIGWAILQPLLLAIIFTLFFHRIAGISSGDQDIPYPVFAYLGLMFWNAFSGALNSISNSLVGNAGVITKIYFPRLIPPLAASALSIVDFFFATIIFVIILLVFTVTPGLLGILLIIPSLLLITVAALGAGLFFAALNVKYRDVRAALPYLVQALFFMTPVIYPITLIPERFRDIAYLNPAAGAISTVKAGIFGQPVEWGSLALSWISAIVLLIIGIWYFKRTEKDFVDVI
ncbi:MAG: ABC transporter permease [Candidatus Saccharimonadales bacterium]